MTVSEALAWASERLLWAGVESPRLEARRLLAYALRLSSEALLRDPSRIVDVAAFEAVLARRVAREPLALIVGRQEFWSLSFEVSPATLVPRADSETLIEAAIAACPDRKRVGLVLDLGTGTGCLLLAALSEFPAAFGVGVDVEPDAAALALSNARRLGFGARAAFVCGEWDSALCGRFDLILCNPPYIPQDEIAGLMPEVAQYEPRRALAGGEDGLAAYRSVLAGLPRVLAPCGRAVVELGAGQADAVLALAAEAGLALVAVREDLGGVARAMVLGRGPEKSVGKAAA